MDWCFAVINNKLAEVYFEKKKNKKVKFLGHCYVKQEEYKTKTEQRWIKQDTEKFKFSYRNGEYNRKV